MDPDGNLYVNCECGESYYRQTNNACPKCGREAPDPFSAFKDVLFSDEAIAERIRSGALIRPNPPKGDKS